jgi:hypothetical protein
MFNYELRPDIDNVNIILIKRFMSYAKRSETAASPLSVTAVRNYYLYISLQMMW